MSEYPIGATIQQGDQEWRVVRIVNGSTTLFQDDKEVYLVVESYIELKDSLNNIGFVQLTRERVEYVGPGGIIKGLNPINFGGDD